MEEHQYSAQDGSTRVFEDTVDSFEVSFNVEIDNDGEEDDY